MGPHYLKIIRRVVVVLIVLATFLILECAFADFLSKIYDAFVSLCDTMYISIIKQIGYPR